MRVLEDALRDPTVIARCPLGDPRGAPGRSRELRDITRADPAAVAAAQAGLLRLGLQLPLFDPERERPVSGRLGLATRRPGREVQAAGCPASASHAAEGLAQLVRSVRGVVLRGVLVLVARRILAAQPDPGRQRNHAGRAGR